MLLQHFYDVIGIFMLYNLYLVSITYLFFQVKPNKYSFRNSSEPYTMFVDMNSFFASCEQQDNYYLRNRPVGVCVYTGKYGCVISPSIEAKKHGIKTGMRLNEAMELCPELVPVETHPDRYRSYHVKIMNVLRKYSQEVTPKSIDEAVIDFNSYKFIYKDLKPVALKIKNDIRSEVGDWLKCSIGIAPNSFLAKLASELEKPDGLTVINEQNIDTILEKLSLTDLPGISKGMETRFVRAGIKTPLDIRYASPQKLKEACKSIVGIHWHYRLNFVEADFVNETYKSMSVMRQLSKEQRSHQETLHNLLLSFCMKLEGRMVRSDVHCQHVYTHISYENGTQWKDNYKLATPLQDGIDLLHIIKHRMNAFEKKHSIPSLLNAATTAIGIVVSDFISSQCVQYSLFYDREKKDELRKTIYKIKDKYGNQKIKKASEITDEPTFKDAIGFGSVKDLHIDSD
ncbi:MAG: DNA polymerase IV [Cytophagaceae bacterium]|nr:DNA polymerase IV [Cytophagaceae bacterium]MDW8455773.1 DNA polymerase IV [Cytophagaceae bacterium]